MIASSVTGTSYTYTIPATPNTTYYWYALPKNSGGTATGCTGTIQSFTYIVITAPSSLGYYVVGYLPNYRLLSDIPDVKFRMTNVVIYAFYAVNGSGTLTAPASGTTLADAVTKSRANNLDGVDMDWEYPTTSDGTDITFTALMKELSDTLHRDARYYLSSAITAGKYAGGIRDAIKNEIFPYVDFFNIMAYDDFSTTTPVSYTHLDVYKRQS